MNNDLKLGSGLVVFCLLVWFWLIPGYIRGSEQAFFPRFITVFIFLPSLLTVIRGWVRRHSQKQGALLEAFRDAKTSMAVAGLFLIYIASINYIGFFPASIVSIVVIMLYMGERSWLQLILTPAVLLLVIYISIERLLSFPLPDGSLF